MKIKGYQIQEEIYQGQSSLVFRGIRLDDQKPVILKYLNREFPTPEEKLRFQREYEVTRSFHAEKINSAVIQAYDLEVIANSLVLVEEDIGGQSLASHIPEAGFSTEVFLKLSLLITQLLTQVHKKDVIHKDINPSNILYNEDNDTIKFIDFGLSTVLTREHPSLSNITQLEGTLAYIAPEQTGRTNMALDYRADYYALGVSFYQLLTGQLPFDTSDKLALVHSHIAKIPRSPSELKPEIPSVISDIVLKLMAKNPDERYQSLAGLGFDLQHCQQQWEKSGNTPSFCLGVKDKSSRLIISQKLYGRETEIEQLLKKCEECQEGKALLLIKGYSGVGKTALVQEIHKPLMAKRGYFFSGKIDQFQNDTPYSSITQALAQLIRQVLAEPDFAVDHWKKELFSVLGANARLITDLIPELERLLGKPGPVLDLAAAEARNRFQSTFINFFLVFAKADHPLVLFLDDLQWIDSASLQLINMLMQSTELQHFLLIGAYRDNEVDENHPLTGMIRLLEQDIHCTQTICLHPLDQSSVDSLIADTLHADVASSQPLAKLIYKKTEGNAFFIHQFLNRIYEDRHLYFKPETGNWEWNLAAIEASRITDNLVDLLIEKINKQPERTRQLLQSAACLGSEFKLSDLAIVNEASLYEVGIDLWRAVESELLAPQGRNEVTDSLVYPSPKSNETFSTYHISQEYHRYQFVHDKIQQSAYALIPIDQQKILHLKTGRLLLKTTPEDKLDKYLFDIVNQLNKALELVDEPEEQVRLATLNLKAGIKAKAAAAFDRALEYFRTGLSLIKQSAYTNCEALEIDLTLEFAECLYVAGNFDEAEQYLSSTLVRVNEDRKKLRIYRTTILISASKGSYEKAIHLGIEALLICGLSIDANSTTSTGAIESLQNELDRLLAGGTIVSLHRQPTLSSPILADAMEIAATIWPFCYVVGRLDLTTLITLTMMKVNLEKGHSDYSSYFYVLYGMYLILAKKEYETGYQFGLLGLGLTEHLLNRGLSGKCHFMFAFAIGYWRRPLQELQSISQQGFTDSRQSGDATYAGYSTNQLVYYSLFSGEPLAKTFEQQKAKIEYVKKIGDFYVAGFLNLLLQAMHCLEGRTRGSTDPSDDGFDWQKKIIEHEAAGDTASLFEMYRFSTELHYYYGNFDTALQFAEKTLPVLSTGNPYAQVVFNCIYGLLICKKIPDFDSTVAERSKAELATIRQQLDDLSTECAANFLHLHLLLEAEIAALEKQPMEKICVAFDQAIFAARDGGYLQYQAIANELAGQYYVSLGLDTIARVYLSNAWYSWQEWGAQAKCKDLEARYAPLLRLSQPNYSVRSGTNPLFTQTSQSTISSSQNGQLDMDSLIKATRAISGEISLGSLLEKLLTIIMENMGARRVLLLLEKDRHWYIEGQVQFTDNNNAPVPDSGLHEPLDTSDKLPVSLVQSVIRQSITINFQDASRENVDYQKDVWYQKHPNVKSVLCTYLKTQAKLIGVLYLENDLAAGVFHEQRLEILKMLCAQAAISIENANLYDSLDEKVRERTLELKKAQEELVRNAREAGMAEIAQGVMHNIGNALTPLKSATQAASRLFHNSILRSQLKKALDRLPDAIKTIPNLDEKDKTRYSKIIEILPNNIEEEYSEAERHLQSIGERVLHIEGIIKLQMKYARLQEVKERVVVKQVIEDALGMLEDNLKSSNVTLDIQHAELPPFLGEKHQLLQVLINLIKNAVEAMKETSSDKRFLKIWTALGGHPAGNEIEINIQDTGIGFTPDQKVKLFNFGFTTKSEGTGVGLHACANYIIGQNGRIDAASEGVGKGACFQVRLPVPA